MISDQTTRGVVQVLLLHLGRDKALDVLNDLCKVKGNQSFRDSMIAVRAAVLEERGGGQSGPRRRKEQ